MSKTKNATTEAKTEVEPEVAVEAEVTEPVVEVKPVVKMYKVTIHSGEDEGDKGDVWLCHNNKPILIQRDKEVTISEYYVECLKHSVIETMVRESGGVERPVRIPRFSYNCAPA